MLPESDPFTYDSGLTDNNSAAAAAPTTISPEPLEPPASKGDGGHWRWDANYGDYIRQRGLCFFPSARKARRENDG
jgi:hypothetical protein